MSCLGYAKKRDTYMDNTNLVTRIFITKANLIILSMEQTKQKLMTDM